MGDKVTEVRDRLSAILRPVLACAGIALMAQIILAGPLHAAVPTMMNFQGRLTNASGAAMADGTYNMKFRLYTVASGGSASWTEQRLVSASQGVQVTNGLFSVQIGSVTSIPASLFASGPLYLEVELPTPATATTSSPSWTEGAMTPRNQLATSAYAFNSETLDGLDSTAFAQIGANNTFTGNTNTFKPTTDSTSSFSIQDATGIGLLTADGTTNNIVIGSTTANANTVFLTVNNFNGANDPTGINGAIYYNTTMGRLRCYEANAWSSCTTGPTNQSLADQAFTAGTNTYLTGSTVTVPTSGLRAGTTITWNVTMTKTAAGTTAGNMYLVAGTAGTTADTVIQTYGTGTPTAAADTATVTVSATIRSTGASGKLASNFLLAHNLSATGFATVPNVSVSPAAGTINTTTAGLKVGLTMNTGAASVITVQQVQVTTTNL